MTRHSSRQSSARGAVRIIGGRWKRRSLEVVDAPGLRPTSDRVRETLFNWLAHAFGGDLQGRSALDMFAGSGALGIEAASRGAAPVVLVESEPRALKQLMAMREKLHAEQLDVRSGDALQIAHQLASDGRTFDVIFLDPPFGQERLAAALPLSIALCAPSAMIYVEAEQPLTDAMLDSLKLETYRADKAGEVFYHLLQRKKNSEETPC
jgi:16S rRNA (guanine966-N2)-methyltransferase